jgi:hypothetical protein
MASLQNIDDFNLNLTWLNLMMMDLDYITWLLAE